MSGKRAQRSERTRAAILDAAEEAFADRGFAGARVDAIARSVGIHRASLFHYFSDKASLYAAVLEAGAAPYFEQVQKLLAEGEEVSAAGRLELIVRGVSLQAEFFARQPRMAKIFLREIADFDPTSGSHLARLVQPLIEEIRRFLEERRREGLCDPVDPHLIVTAVAGSTLFHVAAEAMLFPERASVSRSEADLAAHKLEIARLVERLLGITAAQARVR